MKFDIVIGNPPYRDQAKAIYQNFVMLGVEIGKQAVCMITPSRWLNGGGKELDIFRNSLIENKSLHTIVEFYHSARMFNGTSINGGVCYYLIDTQNKVDKTVIKNCSILENGEIKEEFVQDRQLDEYRYTDRDGDIQYTIVINNQIYNIIHKVTSKHNTNLHSWSMVDVVRPINLFRIAGDYRTPSHLENKEANGEDILSVYCKNNETELIERSQLTSGIEDIGKYKVITCEVAPDRGGADNRHYRAAMTIPAMLKPGELCTGTYMILNALDTKEDIEKFMTFIKSKFIRFLIFSTVSGRHMVYKNYIFVPNIALEFKNSLTSAEIDKELYTRYELNEAEVEYIETLMREMK